MIYLAHSVLNWSLWGQIAIFALPAIVFLLLGAWLVGLFDYKKRPINKGLGIASFVLAFAIPLIILIVGLITK